MKPQDLLDHYGSQIKAAAQIGVSETTIRNWIASDKVPKLTQLAIQALTKGKLKAEKEESKS